MYFNNGSDSSIQFGYIETASGSNNNWEIWGTFNPVPVGDLTEFLYLYYEATDTNETYSQTLDLEVASTFTETCSPAPVCPASNNTQYTDFAGTTYNVKCGLQITGGNSYMAHADTFAKCLEYCDIVGGCAAVTYLDGEASTDTNCFSYSTFSSYNSNSATNVYSGVAVNGATTGSISNVALCPGSNQTTITDNMGVSYFIGCDQTIQGFGPPGGQALASTVTTDLDGCVQYCSDYYTCVGVVFSGYPPAKGSENCYPQFSTGAVSYQAGTQYASVST